MAQLFDSNKYRVVLFDQRGCGKSRRAGDAAQQIDANTTWHLVADIEALRRHLGVERWVVAGGSWGTCLALAYAARHANCVRGMVLRAACLFRDEEFDFFLGPGRGARTSAPQAWEKLVGWLDAGSRQSAHDIALAFRTAALGENAAVSPQDAVGKWLAWEGALMSVRPPAMSGPSAPNSEEKVAARTAENGVKASTPKSPARSWPGLTGGMQNQALLTMHYVVERGFFQEGFQVLQEARNFHFPLRIVHGRHDCVCPVKNGEDLAREAPNAELLLTNAGHSQWESENIDAFVGATDRLLEEMLQTA